MLIIYLFTFNPLSPLSLYLIHELVRLPLWRCSLSRSQQQKYESPDSGSTRGHISWAASIFWKRVWLVRWYVAYEGGKQMPPSRRWVTPLFYAPSWLPAIPLVSSSARNGTADTLSHMLWTHHPSSHVSEFVFVRCGNPKVARAPFSCQAGQTLSRRTAGLTVALCSCCSLTERATFLIASCNTERLCLH